MIRLRVWCSVWLLVVAGICYRQYLADNLSSSSPKVVFPTQDEVLEMGRLSHLVYTFKWSGQTECNPDMMPDGVECHYYTHDYEQGTQVMIVSSKEQEFIAVIFAGTDDLRTALTDGDILLKEVPLLPETARVHSGFENNVEAYEDVLVEIVASLPQHYRLYTTGHSLGAADAVLLGVHMVLTKDWEVTSISFGCPRIGNQAFVDEVNALEDRLHVWRFVLGWDLVPRLPLSHPFRHVGHTIQITKNVTQVYYHHKGNATLGYIGVPLGWSATAFLWVPGAINSHRMVKYLSHLEAMPPLNLTHFELQDHHIDYDDDDFPVNPPDDVILMGEDTVLFETADGDTSVL